LFSVLFQFLNDFQSLEGISLLASEKQPELDNLLNLSKPEEQQFVFKHGDDGTLRTLEENRK